MDDETMNMTTMCDVLFSGTLRVSFRSTRLYPPATCPLPTQSHSDSLTVPGSSAARLPQDMPNGLKVRDHDWRSASSRDSAGPWNPRGKNACRESSRLKSARVRLAPAESLATAPLLIFTLLNQVVAASRGAVHIASVEVPPEVRGYKVCFQRALHHESGWSASPP